MARKNTQWGKFSSVSMFLYLNMSSTFLSTSDRQKTIFLLCQYILIPQIKSMVKANNTSPFSVKTCISLSCLVSHMCRGDLLCLSSATWILSLFLISAINSASKPIYLWHFLSRFILKNC